MTAQEKLLSKLKSHKHICVGLDTDIDKIPEHLKLMSDPIFEFNKTIIEATSAEVGAYKINLAFYEREGKKGIEALEKTLDILPNDVMIIGDAKRGDIGNTSLMYAESVFDHFNFDAITLHPYMGFDSLQPFLNYKDKISFILALTSNPGSKDFEKLKLDDDTFLYQQVIKKSNEWNKSKNIGIVFGATNSDELFREINTFNDLFVLLPGVGAQGGSMEDVVNAFSSSGNLNFLINVSRAIIYADSSIDFASAASQKLKNYNQQIIEIFDS